MLSLFSFRNLSRVLLNLNVAGNNNLSYLYHQLQICFFYVQVDAIKKDYDQAQEELNVNRAKIKERDAQINSLAKMQHKLEEKMSDANLEGKKLDNEVVWSYIKGK